MPTLQFKGKTFVQNHHLAVKYHQLEPEKVLSLTDNLIIHGDNLMELKALLQTCSGSVKCIYIDPPQSVMLKHTEITEIDFCQLTCEIYKTHK